MTPEDLPPVRDVSPDESASSPSETALDWTTIDGYLANSAEPDRALDMLQQQPVAGHVIKQFLRALDPDSATPTSVEKANLRAILRDEMRSTTAPAATPRRPHHRTARTTVWMRAMAACAVLAIGVYAATSWTPSTPTPQRIHTTSRGERISVQLADGSTVILGAQSKLQYGFPFGDNDRSVYLEGEAYFKVAHQTSKPFVVYTAHSATQVLGTEFLIKAYPNDAEAKVVVTDGKVAFRPRESAEGSGTTLVRGDLAQMNTDGLMTVTRNVAVDTYAGWTRGRLSFQQVTLGSMIQDLERWYDITIVLSDPALAQSALSISFDTESVDQAMNMLADVLSLSWTRSGNVITLSPAKRRP